MSSVVVIVNPAAGGGRAARAFEQLHPQLCGWAPGCRVRFTGGRGDAIALADTARREQADVVVAAGGDGTVHEVVNGLLGADNGAMPDLVCLPLGTGCDLARSLRLPASTDALNTPLSSYRRLPLDIGVAELSALRRGDDGVRVLFVNDANAGLGSSVASRVSQSTLLRRLGATAYVLAAIPGIIRGARINLAWESPRASGRADFLNVSICNGPSFGGGIRPCPQARHDDGALHMALIESIPASRVPRLLASVARGADLIDPSIRVECGHSFSLHGDALVETDGEVRGRLPGRFSLLPGALMLRVPKTD